MFNLCSSLTSLGQYFFTLNYEELGIEYRPMNIPDTAVFYNVKKYPNKKLIIYITGDKGESTFKLLDRQNTVVMKGEYANALDTLCKYKFAKSIGFSDGKFHYGVSVIKYFQPLQSGTWHYFNSRQKLTKKEEYVFTHN